MVSDPLLNGAELPRHLPISNVLPVTKYGTVRDVETGRRLQLTLDENLVKTMKAHHDVLRQESPQMHWYRIEGDRIWHTRDQVVIELE